MKYQMLLGSVVALNLASSVMGSEILWTESYSTAQKQAEETGKLIMIDFYTDW